jgi:hypothetical protein
MWSTGVMARLWLGGLAALLALALSWVIPTEEEAETWHNAASYYLVLATFLLWLQTMLPRRRTDWTEPLRKHAPALVLAALLVVGFASVSEPKFRILNDEPGLASIALAMHQDRGVSLPTQSRYLLGEYQLVSERVGKRPLFFPFFVSLVHTLTGYRVANIFVVNLIASGLCLFLFYLLLRYWFPAFWSHLGMVLLASFPLFITYGTSGIFDVPNLLFVLLAFWLFHRFVFGNDEVRNLERLGLTLVILAQIRYESAIFGLCSLIVLLFCVRPSHLEKLTYRSVVIPLLFLPLLWQRRLIREPDSWGVKGAPMFNLSWIPNHLGDAWEFFLNLETEYGTVPLVLFLGLVGALCAVYGLWRRRGQLTRELRLVLSLLLISATAHSVLILAYYWGDLTVSVASRFALPFLPVLVTAAVYALYQATQGLGIPKSNWAVLALGLIVFHWPFATEVHTSSHRHSFREYHTNLDYLVKHFPEREPLIIFDTPLWYIPYRWAVVKGRYANENREELLKGLEMHEYSDILVLQVIRTSDGEVFEDSVDLDPEFDLEPIFEAAIDSDAHTRISRVRR